MINVKRFGHATFETPDLDRQIDYFTQIAGLVLAERENGRAYLATKLGDLVVQLEKGDDARCARLAFQVAPETEFDDIRRGVEAEGLRCQTRNDPSPGIPKMLAFEDPKGTVCEVFATQTPICKKQPVAGIGPIKLGHLAFVVPEPKNLRRLLQPRARIPRVGLDRRLVRVHALRSRPSHREFRARQAHADAPHRLRAEGLGAHPGGVRLPRRQEHSDHLGAGPARARPQHLYLSPQSRTTRSSRCSPSSTRCSTSRSAISIRGRGIATARRSPRSGRCRRTSGGRRRRRTICGSGSKRPRLL